MCLPVPGFQPCASGLLLCGLRCEVCLPRWRCPYCCCSCQLPLVVATGGRETAVSDALVRAPLRACCRWRLLTGATSPPDWRLPESLLCQLPPGLIPPTGVLSISPGQQSSPVALKAPSTCCPGTRLRAEPVLPLRRFPLITSLLPQNLCSLTIHAFFLSFLF